MVEPTHVRRLFDRAVSLPAAERAAFVDRVCANDPALRRDLERLLAAHDRVASVFDSAASTNAPPEGSTTPRALPLTLPSGVRLGPYEIRSAGPRYARDCSRERDELAEKRPRY